MHKQYHNTGKTMFVCCTTHLNLLSFVMHCSILLKLHYTFIRLLLFSNRQKKFSVVKSEIFLKTIRVPWEAKESNMCFGIT